MYFKETTQVMSEARRAVQIKMKVSTYMLVYKTELKHLIQANFNYYSAIDFSIGNKRVGDEFRKKISKKRSQECR